MSRPTPKRRRKTAANAATLASLMRQVVRFREQRDWKQFHNPKDMAIGLCLEAAELLELVLWANGDELQQRLVAKREAFVDELADVLGWVLLFAHDHQIDLGKAFSAKMKKNAAKYPIHKARGRSTKYTEL